jgi:hypothetical protein
MSTPAPTLEQRIATADAKLSDLSKLITETETAIAAADKTAEEERTKALDPALSPDPKVAREIQQALVRRVRCVQSRAGQIGGGAA